MPAVFLVSDTHFGHAGVCRFTHPDDDTVKLRPWTDPDEMDEEMKKLGYNIRFIRILTDEKKKFFIDNGVEVIYPEDIPDFADQINYFYETKTLISLTSSGIANSLFMKPGGTILEIVTPLLQAMGNPFDPNNPVDVREDIHHIYNAMAYNKNHYYLSIQNHDRQSQTIINKMLNHDSFSSLVRNNK